MPFSAGILKNCLPRGSLDDCGKQKILRNFEYVGDWKMVGLQSLEVCGSLKIKDCACGVWTVELWRLWGFEDWYIVGVLKIQGLWDSGRLWESHESGIVWDSGRFWEFGWLCESGILSDSGKDWSLVDCAIMGALNMWEIGKWSESGSFWEIENQRLWFVPVELWRLWCFEDWDIVIMQAIGKWLESGSLWEFGNGRLWSFEDCGGLKIGTLWEFWLSEDWGLWESWRVGEFGRLWELGVSKIWNRYYGSL